MYSCVRSRSVGAGRATTRKTLGLTRSVWRTRAYGDFWSHVLVAEGAVDISAEPIVSLWDLAALQVIVEEAGGIAVCTNGRFHGEVLGHLAGPGA